MSAEKERLVLLNRAGHAPKLKLDVTDATTNGHVLTFDSSTVSWYAAAGGGGGGGGTDPDDINLILHTQVFS